MKSHEEFYFFVFVGFVVFVDSVSSLFFSFSFSHRFLRYRIHYCLYYLNYMLSFFLIFSYLLFVQSTPTDLKWTALSLNHCSGNRINASNDSITEVWINS